MIRRVLASVAGWMALVAVLVLPRPASGQLEAVARVGPRPAMILMLDTGESMDFTALTGSSQACVPGGECEVSRLLMVQEALIGAASDSACVFHQGAPDQPPPDEPVSVCVADIPDYDNDSDDDGLLDAYKDTIRFALLVSDNVDSEKVTASGGFSFGDTQTVTVGADTFAIRLGVRNYSSRYGTMHGIGELGINEDLEEHNELIQAEIAEAIPFNQSSLDAMLADAAIYKVSEPSLQAGPGAYSANACRAKRFVLITDGVGHPLFDGASASNPYDAGAAYDSLKDEWTAVTVIPVSDAAAERLALLELAGIEVTEVADSVDELRAVLESLIAEHLNAGDDYIESQTQGRTTVLTHDNTVGVKPIGKMQIGAAYSVTKEGGGGSGVVRRGHLERLDFLCGEDEPERAVDLANDPEVGLPAQATRTVWTSKDGVVIPFTTEDVPAAAFEVDEAKHSDLVNWFYWRDSANYPFAADDPRLGPVVHSTPAILGRPVLDLRFAAYQGPLGEDLVSFKTEHVERPTVALFGANDGLVHAFILAQSDDDNRGGDAKPELFAYMPSFFLHRADFIAQGQTGVSFVDAPPVVRTVRLKKSADITLDDEVNDKLWRDVMVGGTGPGGPNWYALDVTDVQISQDGDSRPTLLWELPGREHPNVDLELLAILSGDDGEFVSSTTYLGDSWAKPAIGSVTIDEFGTRTERAVAFLPGGRDGGDPLRGRTFYVVQLARDPVLKGLPRVYRSFRTGLGNQVDDLVFPITGAPVAFLDAPGQQTSRVFVGDEGGRLWRIDVGAPDPKDWTMEVAHDAYEGLALDSELRRPVHFAPSIAEDQSRRLVVVYGTGDPNDLGGFTTHQKVFSLTERLKANPDGPGRVFDRMSGNWRIDLEVGEQLTGSATIFDEVAYFTSFSKKGLNVCRRGEGRIWAVDFVGLADEDDLPGSVVPRFATNDVQSRTGFVMFDAPLCSDDTEIENPNDGDRASLYCSLGSAVSFGLEITYAPLCGDQFGDPAYYGDTAGRRPILSAQATGTAIGKPSGTSRQTAKGRSLTPQLRRRLPAAKNQPMPLSWGVVFE